mmetsp:Transcript_15238/g.21413  ORF Transcript_15238/g.21413 Transcript_15238/m.21413 type:complete len:219 (-) Transcript_15238:319-975(-)
MVLGMQRCESHFNDCFVKAVPKWLRVSVRGDIEFAKCRTAFIQCLLGQNKSVAVVVHMSERDYVLSFPEYAKASCAGSFEQVWEHERVAWAIDLVRSYSDSHEFRRIICLCAISFPHGLRPGVLSREASRRFALVWELELIFPFADDVQIPRVKSSGRRRTHDDLGDAKLLTCTHDINGSEVVHFLVRRLRVKWTYKSRDVEHDIATLKCLLHVFQLS